MKAHRAHLIVTALLAIGTATAQTAEKTIFVTPQQLEAAAILPSPPANDSAQTRDELAELHMLEKTRTPAQIARAQADDKEESIFIFADVLGPKFTRSVLPHTALLSDHVKNNEGVITNPAKKTFQRPRPYHLDPTLHPVCKTSEDKTNYSYPSGHGTTGYLEAFVLARLVPEKRDAILARADDYAHNREVCGVHYASDEIASRATAYAVIGLMLSNPTFQLEFNAAQAELRTQLNLTPASITAAK